MTANVDLSRIKWQTELISFYYQGNKFWAKGEAVVVNSGVLQDLIKNRKRIF